MKSIRMREAGNSKQITKQKAQVGDNSNNQFTYDFGVHGNFVVTSILLFLKMLQM